MILIKKIFLILFFFFQLNEVNCTTVNIILKINDEILTNVDINNEKKYLFEINPNLKSLSEKEMNKLSKNSLIRQIIKRNEVKKYFKFEDKSKLENKLLKENYLKYGFNNKSEFSVYLNEKDLNINIIKERLLTDRLWNSFIYEKYKNKIKIDNEAIERKTKALIENQKKVIELNLSEILFSAETSYSELIIFIEKYGFASAANKYSIADTSTFGGKIGWINMNNINDKLKKKIVDINIGEISNPIDFPNGRLIIRINDRREMKSKINLDEEIDKQIDFIKNQQLKNFSLNYFKKLKKNSVIYEY